MGARLAVVADHPMVRAILDAFPDARIDLVRDSSTDAHGLPAEQSIVDEGSRLPASRTWRPRRPGRSRRSGLMGASAHF